MRQAVIREIAIVALLTLFAGGVRLYRLDVPGLWGDELSTVQGALSEGGFILRRLGYLPTRWGLRIQGLGPGTLTSDGAGQWRKLGLDEFSARIPSCLLGIITVPLLYLATRRIVAAPTAALAGLFLALSHWHLLWSQSARFYSLQFLFYSLSLLHYYRATRTRALAEYAAAGALGILAILSQPTAGVILVVFGAHVVLRRLSGDLPRFGRLPVAIVGLVGAALAAIVIRDVYSDPGEWTQFFQRPNAPPLRPLLQAAFYIQPGILLVGLISAYWLHRNGCRLGAFLLLAGVIPPVVFSIVGLVGFVEPRYSLVCLYPWLLLAAAGCAAVAEAIPPPRRPLLAPLPVVALGASQMVCLHGYFTAGGYRSRVGEALAYVETHMRAGDQVCTDPREGIYYLGKPVDISIRHKKELYQTDRRTWIVCGAKNQGLPSRKWLAEKAVLKATFDTYIVGPSERVRVYLFDPKPS